MALAGSSGLDRRQRRGRAVVQRAEKEIRSAAMRTIVLDQPRRLSLVDRPGPRGPGRNEALVRVHRIGICGTDLHAYQGNQPFFTYPRVLGHELGEERLVALVHV